MVSRQPSVLRSFIPCAAERRRKCPEGRPGAEWFNFLRPEAYFIAIFLIMAMTSLRSLSFKLDE